MSPTRACALCAIMLTLGCTAAPPTETVETETRVPVTAAAVQRGAVEEAVLATGSVVAAAGAELVVTAPMPSRVRHMPFGEGERVTRGAVLVAFDIPTLASDAAARHAEVTQARARLTLAHSALTRVTDLFERGIAAQKEVDAAAREVQDAEAALAQAGAGEVASTELASRGTVRAPFSGLVAKRWHNPGDMVDGTSADPVLRLVDPSRLQIEAQIAGPDAVRVRVGQTARIRLTSSAADAPIDGVVASAPAMVDPVTGTVRVRVNQVGHEPLPVGLPVRLDVVVARCDDCLTVPASAIVRENDVASVFVVAADGHARRQVVTLGLSSSTVVAVSKGLEPGARVITSGQAGLPDGAAVTVGQ